MAPGVHPRVNPCVAKGMDGHPRRMRQAPTSSFPLGPLLNSFPRVPPCTEALCPTHMPGHGAPRPWPPYPNILQHTPTYSNITEHHVRGLDTPTYMQLCDTQQYMLLCINARIKGVRMRGEEATHASDASEATHASQPHAQRTRPHRHMKRERGGLWTWSASAWPKTSMSPPAWYGSRRNLQDSAPVEGKRGNKLSRKCRLPPMLHVFTPTLPGARE